MPTRHRFQSIVTAERLQSVITRENILASLTGVAAWLHAAGESTGLPGKLHRNAIYHDNDSVSWLYPNSNTAELISAWLDLAELLDCPAYVDHAVDYANALLNDPQKGLYHGEAREAHGLTWYWTDAGTYTGGYSMRMPFHFHRLYRKVGDTRFLEICDVIGRTLLARQLDSGLVTAAWSPSAGWLPEERMGSRYLYPVATFATLWKITRDRLYRDAYEKGVHAILAMQNPDGSFYHAYDPATAEPSDRWVKLHFYAYILNAFTEAYAVFEDERIKASATRLADHLAGIYYYRHGVPYCAGDIGSPADRTEADSAMHDAMAGLLWVAKITGESVYRDIASKLWVDAWASQLPCSGKPGWDGALLRGINPALQATLTGVPTNRRHLHFDPTLIARCDLWCVVNHVFACRRFLEYAQDPILDK